MRSLIKHIYNLVNSLMLLFSNRLTERRLNIYKISTGYSNRLAIYECRVDIVNLFAMHAEQGPTPIKNMPHFQFISNFFQYNESDFINPKIFDQSYMSYSKKYYPNYSYASSKQSFINLIYVVKNNPQNIKIVVSKPALLDNRIIVVDGLHRVSILMYLGEKSVTCIVSI
jgi:hypothetical protein